MQSIRNGDGNRSRNGNERLSLGLYCVFFFFFLRCTVLDSLLQRILQSSTSLIPDRIPFSVHQAKSERSLRLGFKKELREIRGSACVCASNLNRDSTEIAMGERRRLRACSEMMNRWEQGFSFSAAEGTVGFLLPSVRLFITKKSSGKSSRRGIAAAARTLAVSRGVRWPTLHSGVCTSAFFFLKMWFPFLSFHLW